MTELSLERRVAEFVAANPGLTFPEIARGVHGRNAEVLAVLVTEAFQMQPRGSHPSDRAQVYFLAPAAREQLGRAARRSQANLIARVLLDGERHSTTEIHRRCGSSRLNSRVAELRSVDPKRSGRGMIIDSFRRSDVPNGPDAYQYQFRGFKPGFDDSWLAGTSEAAAVGGGRTASAAAASGVSASTVPLPVSDGAPVQLNVGEAA